MPTYQYACTECGDRLEVVQRFSDDPLTVCAACGGKLRKVFSPVGIVFKGSGFYRTDSRSGSVAGGSANGKSGENGSEGSGGKSDSGGRLGREVRVRRGVRRLGRRSPAPSSVQVWLVGQGDLWQQRGERVVGEGIGPGWIGDQLEGCLIRGERAGQRRRHRRIRVLRVP